MKMKIKYTQTSGALFNPLTMICPYGAKTSRGTPLKVGGGFCQQCKHFKSINKLESYVECEGRANNTMKELSKFIEEVDSLAEQMHAGLIELGYSKEASTTLVVESLQLATKQFKEDNDYIRG